jgi:uncharacterized Tic20 family protein
MEDRKHHKCANRGKEKRLELWWQLYRTSLPERDVQNITPMNFCSTEFIQHITNTYWNEMNSIIVLRTSNLSEIKQNYVVNIGVAFFDVLLTVHLSIFISVFNQLDAQNLFYNKFYFMPLHVSSNMCSSPGGQNCITQPLVSSHWNKWVV